MKLPGFTADASLAALKESFAWRKFPRAGEESRKVIPQGIFCHVLSAEDMWVITGTWHWGVYCHRH